MRKVIYTLFAMLLTVAGATCMTSCGDDDDDSTGTALISIETSAMSVSSNSATESAECYAYISQVESALFSAIGASSTGSLTMSSSDYSKKVSSITSAFETATVPTAPALERTSYTVTFTLKGTKDISKDPSSLATRTFTNN
ncbi:MAG: hypothetical protein LIP02_08160 [Bacteroidales bacterium]|nr:hypothetical protein [Bacteroidales bacterium]